MCDIKFEFPLNRGELLDNVQTGYSVKYLSSVGEIPTQLKNARKCFKNDGAASILDYFDLYYSVLHYSDRLSKETIVRAYTDLEDGATDLNQRIKFILSDKDNLNDDLRMKTQTVMKMLIYIYTQFVHYFEQKNNSDHDLVVKGRTKPKNNPSLYDYDKNKLLLLLNNLLQQDINVFWEPPLVEEQFLNIIAEMGFLLLRNPVLKSDKLLVNDIFGLFGNLIKLHNYGTTFVIRLIQSIKIAEHLTTIAADGVKFLIQQFKCTELIHYLIKEATEWQTEDGYEDTQGARFCSQFLTNLAVAMPDLILPELTYLDRYLYYETVPLRISVLNMYTEVIINVLTKHNLTQTEKESRDMLLLALFEHLSDISANVRSKVIQNINRLQQQNSIPLKYQHKFLVKIIKHLYDKAALVRKASINCVTTFLSYNSYGPNLQLKHMETELQRKTEMLNNIEKSYLTEKMQHLQEIEEKWTNIKDPLYEAIQNELNKDNESDGEDENSNDNQQPEEDRQEVDNNEVSDIKTIQKLLNDNQFVEAFKLCRKLDHQFTDQYELNQIKDDGNEIDFYMFVLKTIYMNIKDLFDQLRLNLGMTPDDLEKIKALENQITYYKQTIEFINLINTSLEPMKKLLFTETISDMHSAIEFFIVAFRFNIDNIHDGILMMLNLMKENEQERKDAVINAYQKIFLTTDSRNLEEHATTVVNNLIKLLDELPIDSFDNFKNIVSNWSAKRMLGNDVIDRLWKYFTKSIQSINDEQSRTATDLLYIASLGRKSIIERNLKLVSTIAFSQRGRDDMLFLASSCRLLSTVCNEQIDLTSKTLPYRLNFGDEIFDDLLNILIDLFIEPVEYYLEALREAIAFIYKVSSKPTANCEKLFHEFLKKINGKEKLPHYILIRLFTAVGNIALRQLSFLDNTVYRELKRRHNCRESEKENIKVNKQSKKTKNKRQSQVSASASMSATMVEESVLEGAQAEDTEAEYILKVIENDLLSQKNLLGHFSSLIKEYCLKPNNNDSVLHGVAVTALSRYMLVSSKFCKDNLRLLFTILERTNEPEIKCTILIHCVDLVTRFPNIVEPWIMHIYSKLKDDNVRVRKIAFFALSNLILRDMIRAYSHISELALCLIDNSEELQTSSKQFFIQLAQKENNLTNMIPDIFSHLMQMESLSEEHLRYIMKFLFDFVDKNKRIENLVDRFCLKLNLTYDEKNAKNVMYCLSLITYNDKALKKLQEKFSSYKNLLHIGEVYLFIKQILNECNKVKPGKPDLRPLVAEIEASIQAVFENDGTQPPPVAIKPSSNAPKKTKRKKPNRKRKSSDDDGDVDNDGENSRRISSAPLSSTKTYRARRNVQQKKIVNDSSDSD